MSQLEYEEGRLLKCRDDMAKAEASLASDREAADKLEKQGAKAEEALASVRKVVEDLQMEEAGGCGGLTERLRDSGAAHGCLHALALARLTLDAPVLCEILSIHLSNTGWRQGIVALAPPLCRTKSAAKSRPRLRTEAKAAASGVSKEMAEIKKNIAA